MNLPQLSQFTEGLAKMLADGIEIKRAVGVAGECMQAGENRRFVKCLMTYLLTEDESCIRRFDNSLPPFYLFMLRCGILTGRLPEALSAAAHYVDQVLPVLHTLRRYGWYSLLAYLVCSAVALVFRHQVSFVLIMILLGYYVLLRRFKAVLYVQDMIAAKTPLTGTWCKQVSLLEFFSCLDICYNSTLSVPVMFDSSIQAVSNRYLRRQLLRSRAFVEKGNSFAESLEKTTFIPGGMICDIEVNEIAGTLDRSFSGFARELRKVIKAKLEVIRSLAIGWGISYGIILPICIVLPCFVKLPWLLVFLAFYLVYLWMECIYMAVTNYTKQAIEVNCWWNCLRDAHSRKG